MEKLKVSNGIFWVEIPEADLRILCGCPADSVKHLMKRGLIAPRQKAGVTYETGPNAILLSDIPIQKGSFANLSEFPVLQMLYRQGMILPRHPNNTGRRPILIGLSDQVHSQREYIYRGNYGLVAVEELTACGVPAETAREMLRIKKWFAFGKIRGTEDLLDLKIVDKAAIELAPGVIVHRTGLNRYEFLSGDQSVEVNLNLGVDEEYEAPYALGSSAAEREFFSVIHIGEGEGWDSNRPCMASIVCFQGRLYLIDAGPNITHSLTALGISVNDLEGIFHTHCHDDHFAGLTSLVRSDRRLRYYAVPYVRASVEKKLAALMAMEVRRFAQYFEVHDLTAGAWNAVDGLEVRPLYSPHPVETTVLFFRAFGQGGHRTYSHFADLPSFEVLHRMVTEDTAKDGISPSACDAFIREVLEPADVKKVDVGGGLIHGNADDFAQDASRKIILSHSSLLPTEAQKEFGSTASFGQTDVLVPVRRQSYLLRSAYRYMKSYFPTVPDHELGVFTNCSLTAFNAGSIILKKGTPTTDIYLILSGTAEVINLDTRVRNRLAAGALAGELSTLLDEPSPRTFRAESAVAALRIPSETYRLFIRRNGLEEMIRRNHENRQLLFCTMLFGEMASFHAQSEIARVMERREAARDELVAQDEGQHLYLLADGEILLLSGGLLIETVRPGEFWGEESIVGDTPPFYQAQAVRDSLYFAIPGEPLKEYPSIQWKLLEAFNRRWKALRTRFRIQWQDFYSVGVRDIDEQHRKLFAMINEFSDQVEQSGTLSGHGELSAKLFEYARFHFEYEENFLKARSYPRLAIQSEAHRKLLADLAELLRVVERELANEQSPGEFFKDWLIDHTLLEDRRFKGFLSAEART